MQHMSSTDSCETGLQTGWPPEHLQRQSAALADLCRGVGADSAEAIDDALILKSWLDLGVAVSGLDGFRLFRNAARKTIAFRQALAEAEVRLKAFICPG